MEQGNRNVNHWLEVFANFRKGSALSEIIKLEESFIKTPYWISPLYQENYRRYHTFDLEGIERAEDFPFTNEGPLWDGICKDDASRKYLFVLAQDTPDALQGDCGDISAVEKEGIAKVYQMLNLDADLNAWYHQYYPLAKALAYVTLLATPFGHCMDRGYRGELILMNIVNNFLGVETTQAKWDDFYREMSTKMFGARGLPYIVFIVDLEV